jgi:hypothetical protein
VKPRVRYEPRKEIIIHEYTHYDSENELVNSLVQGLSAGSTATLRWAEGVIFSFNAFPADPLIIKENLEGRIHWNHVSFAPMPQYRQQIITPSGVTVFIRDVSTNPSFQAAAEFIIKNLIGQPSENT